MEIYKKLAAIQESIKAPKGQYNDFGKYKYRSCEDIIEAVKPLLANAHALIVIHDEIETVGNKTYIKAVADFIDAETGDKITVSAVAREADERKGMDSAQVSGSTSSYARKYALSGLLLLDDAKDPDAMPPVNRPDEAVKQVNTQTNIQRRR